MAVTHTDTGSISKLALIGNYLPRMCGLATFTTDCHVALRDRFPDLQVDVYAMDDHPGRYDYPPAVTAAIAQDDLSAYVATARQIEASGAEAIWVQHEYGIYGGTAGDYLLTLLDRTTLPVIVTLHTILEQPNADERRVMEALLRRAARVVVMAERGSGRALPPHSRIRAGLRTSNLPMNCQRPIRVPARLLPTDQVRLAVKGPKPSA